MPINISTFLDEIDPDNTIDRKKASNDIAAVVLLKATNEIKAGLDINLQKEIDGILMDSKKFNFDAIYNMIDKIGKKEQLISLINENLDEVTKDYIKNQLNFLSISKKEHLLTKFPDLQKIN